jgi:hypothetical protein
VHFVWFFKIFSSVLFYKAYVIVGWAKDLQRPLKPFPILYFILRYIVPGPVTFRFFFDDLQKVQQRTDTAYLLFFG